MSNELYHHGIKGQKWGIRRFQNPDGSLTSEGKDRYGAGNVSSSKFKGDFKSAKKAYRAERRSITSRRMSAYAEDEGKIEDEAARRYQDAMKRMGMTIKEDDPESRNLDVVYQANKLEELDRVYKAGQEEVNSYLNSKYGNEVVSSVQRTDNVVTAVAGLSVMALSVGVVAAYMASSFKELKE